MYVERMPVAWGCRRQQAIAISSCEAEYYAASVCVAEQIHVSEIIEQISGHGKVVATIPQGTRQEELQETWLRSTSNTLYLDSDSARSLIQKQGVQRTRHLSSRSLWFQALHASGALKVRRVDGIANVADILTKYVGRRVRINLQEHLFGPDTRERIESAE
mgnify:CR=1 FL=1